MNKLEKFFGNPYRLFYHINFFHWIDFLSDKIYLQLLWRMEYGKKLDLDNPTTFSEKLQWLKLYDRRPEYTMMVDKVRVKEYVATVLGEDYIIPTIGVWDDPDEINFDALPNRFVVKCNHNSHIGMYICKDKSKMDVEKVKNGLRKGINENYYKKSREWPYKNVSRKIIAEKYIEPAPDSNDLPDYKFFCFNGEPKYCQVITGRESKMCIDFFDENWIHQPFHEPKEFPFAKEEPQCPRQYKRMWQAAKKLAQGKAFSRIDFYEVGDRIYFGEITFFPTGGMGGFSPEKYDALIGSLITLPKVM